MQKKRKFAKGIIHEKNELQIIPERIKKGNKTVAFCGRTKKNERTFNTIYMHVEIWMLRAMIYWYEESFFVSNKQKINPKCTYISQIEKLLLFRSQRECTIYIIHM